jgi:uncharacterized protein (DUF488 family)
MTNSVDETFTIGFTKTSAKNFFGRIRSSGASSVIDVRLNNTSQLSGFAKSKDLEFFLKELSNSSYVHMPILSPEAPYLGAYRKGEMSWSSYESYFNDLMYRRRVEHKLSFSMLQGACLLCSEDTPHKCHRRLVCEYLNKHWNGALKVVHL